MAPLSKFRPEAVAQCEVTYPVNTYVSIRHPLRPFSGVGLSDGVSQGEAGPREFRTAPLWGLGQRIFFLHDGRAADLITAIRSHQSLGSEANVVVSRFVNLTETQKQNLLNFLRSL